MLRHTTQYPRRPRPLADDIAVVDGQGSSAPADEFEGNGSAARSSNCGSPIRAGEPDERHNCARRPRRRCAARQGPRPYRTPTGDDHRLLTAVPPPCLMRRAWCWTTSCAPPESRRRVFHADRATRPKNRWRQRPRRHRPQTQGVSLVGRERALHPSLVHDTLVVARRNLLRLTRQPQLLVFVVIQPVMFVLLFRYVFGAAIRTASGLNYVDFLIPGIMVQSVGFGAASTGIGLAEDLNNGIIDRFRSLPMSRLAVLAGRTSADVVRVLFTVLLMATIGFAVGWRPKGNVRAAGIALGTTRLRFVDLGIRSCRPATTERRGDTVMSFVILFPLNSRSPSSLRARAHYACGCSRSPGSIRSPYGRHCAGTHVGTPVGHSWWGALVVDRGDLSCSSRDCPSGHISASVDRVTTIDELWRRRATLPGRAEAGDLDDELARGAWSSTSGRSNNARATASSGRGRRRSQCLRVETRPGQPVSPDEITGHNQRVVVVCNEAFVEPAAATLQQLGMTNATDPRAASKPGRPSSRVRHDGFDRDSDGCADLTAAWLTGAIGDAFGGAKVTGSGRKQIGTGQARTACGSTSRGSSRSRDRRASSPRSRPAQRRASERLWRLDAEVEVGSTPTWLRRCPRGRPRWAG